MLRYWLPVVIWMGVIFFASTDLLSSNRTSRIIRPLLKWLKPDLSEEALGKAQFVIRKCAHVVEYAVLAVLIWRARRVTLRPGQPGWDVREAALTATWCCVYAATDELHQYFVASRFGTLEDVALDTLGACAGLSSVWWIGRWLKRW